MHLSLTAVVVEDYDPAIDFFVGQLGLGVQFASAPRVEAYGRVVVFTGIAGSKWDLIGPA